MNNCLYHWASFNDAPPVYMARAYYSPKRGKCLFVAFPLNLLVCLAWRINNAWAKAACRPSWIDNEIRAYTNDVLRRMGASAVILPALPFPGTSPAQFPFNGRHDLDGRTNINTKHE